MVGAFGESVADEFSLLPKHEEAGNLELFFDLFFAANYTVFSQNQSVTSSEHFKAYVGYFRFVSPGLLAAAVWDGRLT